MACSSDLDKFRRQWKEEILEHHVPVNLPANVSSTSRKRQSEENGVGPENKSRRGLYGTSQEHQQFPEASNISAVDEGVKGNWDYHSTTSSKKSNTFRFVDIFIADLNDIDPIPFFDIELPREVAIKIFKHLSARDLCRCSQVSKSWKSLAEDELLWCRICHHLGYEQQATTVEKENWKEVVRTAVEMEEKLRYNWKNRVGGLDEMNHLPGGILTAVSSYHDWLAAGYTSLDVKLWDLSTDTSCILSPSSKALVLQEDGSFVWNYVTQIAVNATHVFAIYNTGLLNVWENDSDNLQPVYQCEHLTGNTILRCSQTAPLLGVKYNDSIRLFTQKSGEDYVSKLKTRLAKRLESKSKEAELRKGEESNTDESEGNSGSDEETEKWTHMGYLNYYQLLEAPGPAHLTLHDFVIARKKSTVSTNEVRDHMVITAINDKVIVHDMSHDLTDHSHVTQLYHTAFAPVQLLDYRSTGEVAIIVANNPDAFITSGVPCQVQLYDVQANKKTAVFGPITERMKALNIKDSPENEVVTGGYGLIHVYDKRVSHSVQTLQDQIHAPLSQIQMDEWKVITGNSSGYVCTWDRRMGTKCWEMHNRHPVAYLHFRKNLMITANIPSDLKPCFQDPANPEYMLHKRYRGRLNVLDFSVTQQREELPSICQSTFDEPERYNYNIRLAMPYDTL